MSLESGAVNTFDEFVESYEEACGRGLALSGESRDYFAQQRIVRTTTLCAGLATIERIVDFGCGLGHSTPYLLESFPAATVVGVDTSTAAIDQAQRLYGCARAGFTTQLEGRIPSGSVQLVYSNGTFHHIEPPERRAVVATIREWLSPGGVFVLWENNPWNPGTRLVMRRIPFDRDAKTLSYRTASRLLADSGLHIRSVTSHFYFPAWLARLRRVEPWLQRVPLGAQYCVVGQKSSGA
jgi:trans-aconitate methyltransferase